MAMYWYAAITQTAKRDDAKEDSGEQWWKSCDLFDQATLLRPTRRVCSLTAEQASQGSQTRSPAFKKRHKRSGLV